MSDKTLRDRIDEAMSRVGKMCSEGRPPRMSIPVSPYDDDTFINDTLRECRTALADSALPDDDDDERMVCENCQGHGWVALLKLADSADAPKGPWEELKKAATLYISALKYLVEGHYKGDGWERLMAIRDSVRVQEERWRNALNRLDAQQTER